MQVRTGGASAHADVANYLAALHVLASDYSKAGKMSVARSQTMTVVDGDHAAVAVERIGKCNLAVGGGKDLLSEGGRNIDTGVECALTVERIRTFAEGTGNRAGHWPKLRGVCGAHPIGQ